MGSQEATVAVTGANGFVGARVCTALAERGARVRAIVRRAGTAPVLAAVEEWVGDFSDHEFVRAAAGGSAALISTVHPMDADRATQQRVGVAGTAALAEAAVAVGIERFIHVSTAAVYDRSPGVGDVDETSALVGDDAGDYAVTKRDTDLALGRIGAMTRILLRPPAILGPGPTSTWNTLRPAAMLDDARARSASREQTFAWVHVTDLATLAADLAVGRIDDADDVAAGPLAGECVALNVAAAAAKVGDYVAAVTGALGLEPEWETGPSWTGRLVADRARGWGWAPTVDLDAALAEIVAGLEVRS